MPAVVNAMTIDVEDYFHVSAFDRRACTRDDWPAQESRVERQHAIGCCTCWPSTSVRATFFVLGWVAERCPGLVRAHRRRRP